MAEMQYTGRGRGPPTAPHGQQQAQQPQQQTPQRGQRPTSASPRLHGPYPGAQASRAAQPSAQHMLAFLDLAEQAAAKQVPVFPSTESFPEGVLGKPGAGRSAGKVSTRQQQRPKSAVQLRTSGQPRLAKEPPDAAKSPAVAASPPAARQYGRISIFDRDTDAQAPHEVLGPKILRDLDQPRVGFPSRPPEDFLKAGSGLSLRQRNQLKEHLKRCPVNVEPPFKPGTGGVRISTPHDPFSPSLSSASPRTLLRTYYDNGTLDFVAVRWRGSRAGALVWAREVTRGPEQGGPLSRTYTAWFPSPPPDLPLPAWLPVFLDGVREAAEPYRFIAIRGCEELMEAAGDTLHTLAPSLVAPLRAVLETREPTCVAVGLQLAANAIRIDPRVAQEWVPHYWQFAQVLNLFRTHGGRLLVDMGYNKRAAASCRRLASDFMTLFELAGGTAATAAVRRYSPGCDPVVTDVSMARAAAKAAARAAEVGMEPGSFKPFTLM
ncbi:hypothetical protein Agub_g10652 [Astrephomene gubernaculifera]|uniref:Uncharacterized protein n=1 Tax=Astrephomene gubernaculifera TaxID=47775 RepID=A0AAD3HQ05_9CHLO|nr:hypothetical protein Agub_g10652 [Astrephomene gubernaculifera]